MATTSYNTPSSVQTLDSNIASIAVDGKHTCSSTINNEGGDVYADFELEVAFDTAPDANEVIELYFLKNIDAAHETGDGGGETLTAMQRVGRFTVADVTATQRLILESVILPNSEFEVVLVNSAGQATSAGAALKYRTFNMKSA